jgi:hypothetical protein
MRAGARIKNVSRTFSQHARGGGSGRMVEIN